MTLNSYEIVAGWNGTTANIESISVSGATALTGIASILDAGTHFVVQGLGNYNVPYRFTAGGAVQNGFAVETWIFPVISTLALNYLISTYGQGSSQNGKVTVSTRLHTETYVSKNAWLFVPYPNTPAKLVRDSLYIYDEGVVTAQLRIVGDTA